jgi:hypothetical protein
MSSKLCSLCLVCGAVSLDLFEIFLSDFSLSVHFDLNPSLFDVLLLGSEEEYELWESKLPNESEERLFSVVCVSIENEFSFTSSRLGCFNDRSYFFLNFSNWDCYRVFAFRSHSSLDG